MQLIADAVTVGIPVYHVTPANAATVLPLLSLDARVMSDVRNAHRRGQDRAGPRSATSTAAPGAASGYIVAGPGDGAGAYLISGGANGGGLFDCLP